MTRQAPLELLIIQRTSPAMSSQPFQVHYEQQAPTRTKDGKLTSNGIYKTISLPYPFKLEDLRSRLATLSIPAAPNAYNGDPDHQRGFEDTKHEGSWKFHFIDSFGHEEKDGKVVVERKLDEEGFKVMVQELGAMTRTWRSARIWHVSIA